MVIAKSIDDAIATKLDLLQYSLSRRGSRRSSAVARGARTSVDQIRNRSQCRKIADTIEKIWQWQCDEHDSG
jgi:hypothetical protein